MVWRSMISLLFLFAASGLSACVSTAGLSDRVLAFNAVEADAADSQLLLNIVRSAHRNPTHYSTLQTIRESRSLEGSGTVAGSFPFGRDAGNLFGINPQLAAAGNLTPSFDVVPLSTRSAALGLYSPVSPDDLVLYWNQGWPRALVLSLFVDEVVLNDAAADFCDLGRVELPRNVRGLRYVDNSAYGIDTFENAQRLFDCLSDHLYITRDDDPLLVVAGATGPNVLSELPGLADKGFSVRQTGDAGASSYAVRRTEPGWKFRLLEGDTMGAAESSPIGRNSFPTNSKKFEINITLRSVDGMIYYLGEVLRLRTERNYPARVVIQSKKHLLFEADSGSLPTGDAITATFSNRKYAISRTGREGDATLTTLSLLTQIFALHREDTDIPRTTAVQIVGSP